MRLARSLAAIMCAVVCGAGCGGDSERADRPTGASVTATQKPGVVVDETGFWSLVEQAHQASDGDADEMADHLRDALADSDTATLAAFQRLLVQASQRLYTWRHGDAGEMICGYLGDDGFTDFRSWIITRGKDVFDAVVADPDALADVEDVEASCEGGEAFGAVPTEIYFDLIGDYFPDDVPILETFEPPSGQRTKDPDTIRKALPKLAAHFPDGGQGKEPIQR